MELEVGSIVEGKISGITKFGAFVALPEGKSGLVHISEVANAFVADVSEHVQMGQTVKVKVLSISPEGKINLSIKRAVENRPAERAPAFHHAPAPRKEAPPTYPQPFAATPASVDQTFEDRLKKFMQESDSRIADNRIYAEHRSRGRRR
ncbi:MAG: S1 RNA-binding domain-containing protein [Oscillospiraceae bacterium]|nr:S1 RNA-binding domain-containing protein [Oscillospiraceae bacterium]